MPQQMMITCAASLAVLAGSTTAAQDAEPLVDVRFRGIAEIQPAEKDAAAHAALMSLGSRLRMLPREIPDFEADRKWIDAMWKLATGSGGLMIAEGDGVPIVSATIVPLGGTGDVMPALSAMLTEAGGSDVMINEDGSLAINSPAGVLQLAEANTNDGQAITLRFGDAPVASVAPATFDLPANAEPVLSASIEVGKLVGTFADLMADEEPQAFEQFDRFGFLNAGEARLDMAYGAEGDAAFITSRLTEAKPWIGRFFGESSFDKADLAMVPSDATLIGAACVDFGWTLEIIDAISEDTGRDFVQQIRDGFGIDLDSGLLSNIGPRWIYYQADSTGGGGVLSAVILAELRDADAFKATQASALIHGNQFAGTLGRGYVRSREWQLNGNTVWSAVFPGIPVPIEPSWTIVDGWLVAAATPVGLTSAVAAIESPASVLDNPKFQQAVGDRWPGDPVVQVSFVDTQRFAGKGYGPMSLAASGLANAARMPFNAGAEPGTIMPAYGELLEGIRPGGAFTTWSGDDLVQRVSMDSSAIVQLAALFGQTSGWQSMYAPAAGAGVLLPALGQARQSAQQLKSSTQVRGLIQGAHVAAVDVPAEQITVDFLLENGYIAPEMLESPMGNAWDGGPDIVLRQQFGDTALDSFDASLIVAMDRAMYINGEDVTNVGFADGHVEALDYWSLDEYLDMPKNAGLREEWGLE